jgi:hypothetical protein
MVLPLIAGIGSKLLSSGKTEDKSISASKKKIKTEKLFDKKTDGGALVKTEKSSIQLRPSSSLVKYNSKDKSLDLTPEEKKNVVGDELQGVIDEVKKLRTNLVKVRGLLAEKKNSDLSNLVQNRKLLQLQKAKKRETDLEKRKPKKKIGKIEVPKPKISFLETIQNFFMNVLIGSLLNLLIANRNTIFKAFDDISKGLTNIFDVIRYSIISLSTTMPKLVKSIASFGKKIFAGPAKLTANLLKKLGGSIKNLLVKTGKALGNFVSGTFKNLRGLAGGAGTATTRATGVQQRGLSRGAGTRPQLRQLPRPGTPKPTSGTTLKNAERLFTSGGFKHFKKVSAVFKKVPFIGALIGIGIDLAMGERLDNAIAGAAGASLGAAIGGAIGTAVLPIPFVGTFLGGTIGAAIGDWAGKEIYKNLSGQITQINPPPEPTTTPGQTPTPAPGTTPLSPGFMGSGAPGQLYTSNASVTWYNPGLGGINSGTGRPDPNARTSTGEPYQASAFTAAAFPPFLSSLPLSMTTRTPNNPSGRTLARGQQFNVLVTNKKTGKSAILRVNDVGSGVGPASKQTKWLDFSVAARDYLGTGSGFEIRMAPPGSKPGPLDVSGVQQIQRMGASANANATSSYTVAGITYDTATGRPIDFPGQRTSTQIGTKTGLVTGYGGGTPFHIDTRWARDLPMDVVVPMIDSMASALAADGRVMEMGSAGSVSGKRYPLNGTRAQKEAFLRAATAGHHKQRSMAAFDYFIPKSNETRFGKSAEYANIPAPALPPGYKMTFHMGRAADGGAFYQITDPSGRVVFKTFHGDPNKSRLGLVGQKSPNTLATQTAQALRQQASYDQRGGNIVIPTPIVSPPATPLPMAGGGGLLPIGMNKKDALNSYYQAQLIGFLYKQG